MNVHTFLTIIVPTHRRARRLRRTLLSSREQSFKRVQVIVISDVNDLPTMDVCHELLGPQDSFVRRGDEGRHGVQP